MRLGLSTTAAATTGPASGLRPASSSPTTGHSPSLIARSLEREVGLLVEVEGGAENRNAREPCCGDARIGSDPPQGLPGRWGGGPEGLSRPGSQGRGWTDFQRIAIPLDFCMIFSENRFPLFGDHAPRHQRGERIAFSEQHQLLVLLLARLDEGGRS